MKMNVVERVVVPFKSVGECKAKLKDVLVGLHDKYNVNLSVVESEGNNVTLIDSKDVYNKYPELDFRSVDKLTEVELFVVEGETGMYVFGTQSEPTDPSEKMVEYSPVINGNHLMLNENKVYNDLLTSTEKGTDFSLTYA